MIGYDGEELEDLPWAPLVDRLALIATAVLVVVGPLYVVWEMLR